VSIDSPATLLAMVQEQSPVGHVLTKVSGPDGMWSLLLRGNKDLLRGAVPASGWNLRLHAPMSWAGNPAGGGPSASFGVEIHHDRNGLWVSFRGIHPASMFSTVQNTLAADLVESISKNPELLRALHLLDARLLWQEMRAVLSRGLPEPWGAGPRELSEQERWKAQSRLALAADELHIWRHPDPRVRQLAWDMWLYNRYDSQEDPLSAHDLVLAATAALD
jgi:hypothetical protein